MDNLGLTVSNTLPKEVMMDINVLTVGSGHRVFRQMYRPWLSSFTVEHPISRSGKIKLQRYRMKIVSRKPVAIATYSAFVDESVMDLCVLE